MESLEGTYLQELPSEIKIKIFSSKDETLDDIFTKKFLKTDDIDSRTAVSLSKSFKIKNVSRSPKRHGNKRLSLRERRRLGLYQLSRTGLKYQEVLPLHNLWTDYMKDCLNIESLQDSGWNNSPMDKNFDMVSMKLYRADYHGAVMTVRRSTCPSHVGLQGIVVMETKNCFRLLGEDNIVRTIPKATSEFSFQLDDFAFSLFGKNFLIRPADRSSKRVKSVKTADL